MTQTLIALAALLVSASAALGLRSRARAASRLGAAGSPAALAICVVALIRVLSSGHAVALRVSWAEPFGELTLGIDALSSFFLLIILSLSVVTALYGVGYLERSSQSSVSWFFFNLLVASMIVVVIARHVLVFLLAWETMALTSFFLVAHHHGQRSVRRASWIYLIASHLGSFFLLPMFFLLAPAGGSLAFSDLGHALAPWAASSCFVLAVIGFGCKAGLMPLHVWLPEAHPAAPSHVSALMSGVMIKMGVYGLLRVAMLLGEPPLWWGWLLLALGAISALLGVLFALAQHDLKRLLAYHSVENVGIIVLGIGVGFTGLSSGAPHVAVLGFTGALLHVLNHAVFKGLLFLGAGSVLRATHTAEIDELGGLMRRMPVTGSTFLVGCLSICGLPPFNGFVSEFLIFWAMIAGVLSLTAATAVPLGATVAVLASVGGLALACFAKAFGIVFLGLPRRTTPQSVVENGPSMTAPMVLLAAACLALGLSGPLLAPAVATVVADLHAPIDAASIHATTRVLSRVTLIAAAFMALVAAMALVRHRLLYRRESRAAPTWDCGYVAPSATMQYTASSFAQPIVDLYGSLLRTRKRLDAPEIHFPEAAHLETETPDLSREGIYEPLFEAIGVALRRMLVLQHGQLHIYVLAVVLTLIALLLWQVGWNS